MYEEVTKVKKRVMTRLENDRFKKFCHEKGFKGDLEIEDYDIFM